MKIKEKIVDAQELPSDLSPETVDVFRLAAGLAALQRI